MIRFPRDVSPLRILVVFLILFAVYQAAEGVGDKLLHSFPVQAGLMIVAVLAPWPLGRWLGYRGYDAWGLHLKPRSLAMLGALLLLAILAKAAALLFGAMLGVYSIAPAASAPPQAFAITTVVLLLVETFIPSIAEDMLTRGFFLRAANPGFSGATFVLVTAAVFTANHIYRFDAGWTEQARLFVEGCAYAAAAWRWRTLWAATGLHWGYNFGGRLFDPVVMLNGSVEAGRWLTISVHLGILAIVLLVPGDDREEKAAAPPEAAAFPLG